MEYQIFSVTTHVIQLVTYHILIATRIPGGRFTKMLSALIVMLKVKIYKIQNTKSHWWITSSVRHLCVICPMQ